jgi:glucose-induced degradation protein 8
LEDDSTLFFHLQRQQLIELIRNGKTDEALAFAQEFLAYKGEENEDLLDELGALLSLNLRLQPAPERAVADEAFLW